MSVHVSLPEWPIRLVRALAATRGTQVWPVGGVVRDALLERRLHDWDFAVERDALGLARAVADALGGAYYPLDAERDAGRVVLRREGEAELELDFAALRGPDLEADLLARDFTLNAMAVQPDGLLVDPSGGLADLEASRVRAVGPEALDSDPLRMLRAVRLTAELAMRLEAKTAAWIVQRAPLLSAPSPERVRDELVRILAVPSVADQVHVLDELALLPQIIPELVPLKEQAQSPPHRFDVWWHTLLVVEATGAVIQALGGEQPSLAYVDAPDTAWQDVVATLGRFGPAVLDHLTALPSGRALLHLAALCHDVGKPLTCTEDEGGRLRFFGHEHEGAEIVAGRMRRLRFSRAETALVETIVHAHLRPGHLARTEGPVTRRAVYRFFRATREAGVPVVVLNLADHLSTWGPGLEPERWMRRLEVAEVLLAHYFERHEETIAPPPVINGVDLMNELELAEGPLLGELLAAVREAQAAGEVGTREEALALVRSLLQEKGPLPS
jgi:tRNA nucleotidyltransferase/poly(A) polymerase